MYDYKSIDESIKRREELLSITRDNTEREKRLMRKGWKFIMDTTISPAVHIFASPEKQKAIKENNRQRRIEVLTQRKERIKQYQFQKGNDEKKIGTSHIV